MIPGHPYTRGAPDTIILSVDAEDVDLWADLGEPAYPVYLTVYVAEGVTLSSNASAIPALDLSGFAAGSILTLFNDGDIRGAGGDGGDGAVTPQDSGRWGCGGGGGAGLIPGVRGVLPDPLDPGELQAGTDADPDGVTPGLGNLEGLNGQGSLGMDVYATNGVDGGDALLVGDDIFISIVNVGNIWSGGGGGGGGMQMNSGIAVDTLFGGDGGVPGDDGQPGISPATETPTRDESGIGGDAGFAVRGTNVSFTVGELSPNVKGPVGP